MPNWCECDLIITGPRWAVLDCLRHARGDNGAIDFGRFVPGPDALGADCDWCVDHWGTKWNARRPRVGRLTVRGEWAAVDVEFSTAWTPPRPVITRASELFPTLTLDLRYFERGCGFRGRFCCTGGGSVIDETESYTGPRGG